MPRVRMKVEAFGWLAEFSTDHPDVEFTMLTSCSTEDGHVTLVETEGLDSETVRQYFDDNPDVRSYEVLHAGEQRVVFQYLQEAEPAPGRAGRASGNPPPFPMIVQNGWVHSEATTSHDRLSQFKRELEAAGVPFEVLSLTQSYDPIELLTDRQRQFTTEAIKRGYYDTPRRCSLTELATVLDVNKATASGIIHRAEGAIIKEFMGEPR